MAGAGLEINLREIERLEQKLGRFSKHLEQPSELMAGLASLIESQTKHRIADEKRAPDGTPWEPWSKRYARTRHGNQGLLVSSGHLLQDIASESSADAATVFTSLLYGPSHQYGDADRGIPARPFLGLSDQNVEDIERLIETWIEGLCS